MEEAGGFVCVVDVFDDFDGFDGAGWNWQTANGGRVVNVVEVLWNPRKRQDITWEGEVGTAKRRADGVPFQPQSFTERHGEFSTCVHETRAGILGVNPSGFCCLCHPRANEGRTVNPGERVGEVREGRSEKSEVSSSIAVSGSGSRVLRLPLNAGGNSCSLDCMGVGSA
ncbi:MAG: hypothetical protein RLZZ436_2104 [Planctomycetota bacterium]